MTKVELGMFKQVWGGGATKRYHFDLNEMTYFI